MANATSEENNELTIEQDVDDWGGMMAATDAVDEDHNAEDSIDFSATTQMEEVGSELNVSKDEQYLDANLDDWQLRKANKKDIISVSVTCSSERWDKQLLTIMYDHNDDWSHFP